MDHRWKIKNEEPPFAASLSYPHFSPYCIKSTKFELVNTGDQLNRCLLLRLLAQVKTTYFYFLFLCINIFQNQAIIQNKTKQAGCVLIGIKSVCKSWTMPSCGLLNQAKYGILYNRCTNNTYRSYDGNISVLSISLVQSDTKY